MICYYESIGLLLFSLCIEGNYCMYDVWVVYVFCFIYRLCLLGFLLEEICMLFLLWNDCECVSVDVKVVILCYVVDFDVCISEL